MKYLADSDWIIAHLRGVNAVTERLLQLRPDGIGLSIISVAAIYDGLVARQNRGQEAAFQSFLASDVTVLDIDEGICWIFAEERVRLRRAGTPIGDLDLFIAATAVKHGLIVLTNNVQHFRRVEGLEIISIQHNGES